MICSDEVTLKELLHELKELKDWFLFGEVVGVPQAQLITIQRDGRTTEECRRLMLQSWIKLEKPTWSKVVSSLFKCGMTLCGWKLAEKYRKDEK